MKMAKSYKFILLILTFIISTMFAFGMMKSPSVYADVSNPVEDYFNVKGTTSEEAKFTSKGLEITAKDDAEISFKNNLIVNDLSMKIKLPKGFKTSINITLSSFYVNGNPKEWSKNAAEGTEFDKTIKNVLDLRYDDGNTTKVRATLNGVTFNNLIALDNEGFITIDFAVVNNHLTINNNDISNMYGPDQSIYYKVKNIDNRAVSTKIAIRFDTIVDGDTATGNFILEYVDQMTDNDENTNDYKQSLMLKEGETKPAPAEKSRVYLNESFYIRQADGGYIAKKIAYNQSYSLTYKACSVFGSNVYLCLVNPDNQYDVILESSTSTPDRIRFNSTSNGNFAVGIKKDGESIVFEEFTIDEIVSYNTEDTTAPVYIHDEIAYQSFLNALEKEYTVQDAEGKIISSAGLGTKLEIPSMKDLIYDDFSSYENLTTKVYYRNQSQSTSSSQMSFNLNKIGDYMFFVAFTDESKNAMEEKDFIIEKDNVITNGIYGKDANVSDYVGNFVFEFEIQDNAEIIVKEPEKQGPGYKGVEYKASKFIIDADGCKKTYELFYNANINATEDDKNWVPIPSASDIEETYNQDGYTYDEVMKVNYNGELTFVPTRIGAYMIKCTATSSVSERSAESTTIIQVASEPNVVEVPSQWLQNNVWSIVFLSIGTLSLIGIIILLCIKPKEQTDKE